jgi:hypothetical protein
MSDPEIEPDRIKRLMRQAFEEAFQLQIGSLYKVYLANISSVDKDKQRAATAKGIGHAIAAYRLALEAIEAWEG